MPEIRQSAATKEWVIIATERARRPHEFASQVGELTADRPPMEAACPFCPGNEEPPPIEQARVPEDGPWELRVLWNKFPALAREGERVRHFDGIHRTLSGVGQHEVIVEARAHNTCLALMPPAAVALTLRAFRGRGLAFRTDPRIEHIVYFENHGQEAGTSIVHPHAQMVGLPVVPYQVRSRLGEAQRYFDDTGNCVMCDTWRGETEARERLVAQNDQFVAFIPYAAFSPFHTWVVPREHCWSYLEASDGQLESLAAILQEVLLRLYIGLRDPSYNLIIRSAPLSEAARDSLHWYCSIIPRVSDTAGFEMSSGMFINTALPEESAAFLRGVVLDAR